MRGALYRLVISIRFLTQGVSLIKRRRTLHITAGARYYCAFLAGRVCLLFLSDGFAKGFIDFPSSCTGCPLSVFTDMRYSSPLSLKKKELFHVKEAHNHSFSHAVRIYICVSLTALMISRRQTGDGITIGRDCDNLYLTYSQGAVCTQRRSVLYEKHRQEQRCIRDHLHDYLYTGTTDLVPDDSQISRSKGPARIGWPAIRRPDLLGHRVCTPISKPPCAHSAPNICVKAVAQSCGLL
jgi:hypothetical protein